MNKPKVIAYYLPQFHRVKENDEWWGEGYTEWTAVRSADSLFSDHEQPHVPLHNNYYDLLKPEVMQWQAKLMKKYGIDGACFYHYYFKDGRKILEKPAENLLHWKYIDMPFCFSWANESWVRSWSKLLNSDCNTWSEKFDNQNNILAGDSGILLKQEYGDEIAWRKHYEYLLPFFRDERYIKQDGMPVFVIHRPENISCLKRMLICWDRWAKEDGFTGIYTIGANTGANIVEPERLGLRGTVLQEPSNTIARFFSKKNQNGTQVSRIIDYHKVWHWLIEKDVPQGISLGAFTGYDDTPRRGHGGTVICHRSPYVFYDGMRSVLIKACQQQAPYVFLNAWNEWGEGMYIEPDKKFGYQFLEALYEAKKDAFAREVTNVTIAENTSSLKEELKALQITTSRYHDYWRIYDYWVTMMEEGSSPALQIQKFGVHSVAVYGYGMFGKHLVREMQSAGVEPCFLIDQQREKKTDGLPLYSLEDELPDTDLIIVTVLYDYEKIRDELALKSKAQIISLEELLTIE